MSKDHGPVPSTSLTLSTTVSTDGTTHRPIRQPGQARLPPLYTFVDSLEFHHLRDPPRFAPLAARSRTRTVDRVCEFRRGRERLCPSRRSQTGVGEWQGGIESRRGEYLLLNVVSFRLYGVDASRKKMVPVLLSCCKTSPDRRPPPRALLRSQDAQVQLPPILPNAASHRSGRRARAAAAAPDLVTR